MEISAEIEEKGYAVRDVLSEDACAYIKELHDEWRETLGKTEQIHGIYKHYEVAHQRFVWYVKTRPEVQATFADIWGTPDLVTGFDGACYFPKENKKPRDKCWTHTDQAPDTPGKLCIQSFLACTENKERTLVVYEGSHLLWEPYMRDRNLKGKNNWILIDPEYLKTIEDRKRIIHVKVGQMVFWDSRTFHQNQSGRAVNGFLEERLVIYVCFLPRSKDTKAQAKKRLKYFQERRVTSHWPYPLHVNGKQPRTWGDKTKLIDYDALLPPDLSGLESDIMKIL